MKRAARAKQWKNDSLKIKMHREKIRIICGIYYLYYRGSIVYVGQALDIDFRIRCHVKKGTKKFDAWSFRKFPCSKLDVLELTEIMRLRPRYNRTLPISADFFSLGRIKAITGESKGQIMKRLGDPTFAIGKTQWWSPEIVRKEFGF